MKKKKHLILIIAIISLISLQITDLKASYICGDANSDGITNVSDAIWIINYVFTDGPEPDPIQSGDANWDSEVNVSDAVYVINYVFNNGPVPICFQIPATTKIIPQDHLSTIQEYDTLTGILTLDGTSDYTQEIEIGDIIIGQNNNTAPYGFLRRATAKTIQGSSIIFETEAAALMEAFESMDISEEHQLLPSELTDFELAPGVHYLSDKNDRSFNVDLSAVMYDQDGNYNTTNDQIKLEGNYSLTPRLFTEIVISAWTLEKFETTIETDESVNLDLVASIEWQFGSKLVKKLAEFHCAAIPVGGVVWIVPTLTIEAHIDGNLSVTVETGIDYTQELRYGFGWDNGSQYMISEGQKDFNYVPPQLSTEFNFEMGTSLGLSSRLYGVVGPYIKGEAGLIFQASLNPDPCDFNLNFFLDAILRAVAGISIDCHILGLDINKDWDLYTYRIGEWIYPIGYMGAILINAEPDSINAPWSLVGPCEFSQMGTGDDTLSNLNTGDYTINWGYVPGWIAPADSELTLAADDTLTFHGNYIEETETDSTGTVMDIEGNVYQTIKIGDQWWMAENLKVTRYRNSDPIPNVINNAEWSGLTSGAYCEYDNNPANVETYGRLYNWYAATDSRNIAPEGWHVPTDDDWKQLEMYLGMSLEDADDIGWRGTDEGGKLKESGTYYWTDPNTGATNASGFSALPAGYRSNNLDYFNGKGSHAYFWYIEEYDTDRAWRRLLYFDYSTINRSHDYKHYGFSIRCVKD